MYTFVFYTGNNPVTVCENCKGDIEDYCTVNDPYAGYDGAFRCMAEKDGDVAFVRHFTPEQSSTSNTTWSPQASCHKVSDLLT